MDFHLYHIAAAGRKEEEEEEEEGFLASFPVQQRLAHRCQSDSSTYLSYVLGGIRLHRWEVDQPEGLSIQCKIPQVARNDSKLEF